MCAILYDVTVLYKSKCGASYNANARLEYVLNAIRLDFKLCEEIELGREKGVIVWRIPNLSLESEFRLLMVSTLPLLMNTKGNHTICIQ